jgi:hypothetical protein
MKKAPFMNGIITTITAPCWMLVVTPRGEDFTVHMSESLNENIKICEHLTEDNNADSLRFQEKLDGLDFYNTDTLQ